MSLRKVLDTSISDREFTLNPGSGKYRIEIDSIDGIPMFKKMCMVMLTKQLLANRIPVPFVSWRKAVISEDNEAILEKVIIEEFPGYESYDIRFLKTDMKFYPHCKIQSLDFSTISTIHFTNEKQIDQWIKPIEKAIKKFGIKHYRSK